VSDDVADMRRRLGQEKPKTGPWDMKNGPGGLMDIELLAQWHALQTHSADRSEARQLPPGASAARAAYETLSDLKTVHAILCRTGDAQFSPGAEAWNVFQQHCKIGSLPQLEAETSQLRGTISDHIDTALKD
ncbi:MAG: hypothetical protein AAF386_10935, partial [Pseudomonadota bacterium]